LATASGLPDNVPATTDGDGTWRSSLLQTEEARSQNVDVEEVMQKRLQLVLSVPD
jgi:hypothetical protein